MDVLRYRIGYPSSKSLDANPGADHNPASGSGWVDSSYLRLLPGLLTAALSAFGDAADTNSNCHTGRVIAVKCSSRNHPKEMSFKVIFAIHAGKAGML